MENKLGFVSRFGVSLIAILFLGILASPGASATTGWTWTHQTDSTVSGDKNWYSAGSSASGQYLAGLDLSSGVYVSNDYGTTWTKPDNTGSGNWQGVSVGGTGQYMAVADSHGGLHISNDYGVSWSQPANTDSQNWVSTAISSTGQYMAAADDGTYLWTSDDYGVTWTERTSSTTQDWGKVAISGDGRYVLSGVQSGGALFVSSDYGATWTNPSSAGSRSWQGFTVSESGQYMATQVWTGDIWTSNDYGATWTDHSDGPTNQPWNNIASSSSGQYIFSAAGYGDIYVSSDYGTNWTNITPDDPFTGLYWQGIAVSASGQRIFGAVRMGGLYTANNPALAPRNIQVNNSINASPISISTPSGTEITQTSAVTTASLASTDGSYSYPVGLVTMCYNTSNASDEITLTFATDLNPSDVILRDFNSSTHTYTTVTNAQITKTTLSGAPALRATYSIADNGPLDSNSAVGMVCDPVGLAVSPFVGVKVPNTGLAPQSPQNNSWLLWLTVLPLPLETGYWYYRRQNYRKVL